MAWRDVVNTADGACKVSSGILIVLEVTWIVVLMWEDALRVLSSPGNHANISAIELAL